MTVPMENNPVAMITGATGYIGSRIAHRLAAGGWSVHALARDRSSLDLLQPGLHGITVHRHDSSGSGITDAFADARPHVVFHLAAHVIAGQHRPEDVTPLVESNVHFPARVLEGMMRSGTTRIINTGTFSQYFDDSDYSPTNLYAATKQAFEAILLFYQEVHQVRGITLVLFDTYGPGDPRDKVFSQMRRASLTGEPLPMSPGEQLLDLVYIDDVVDAYVHCARRLLDGHVQGPERYSVSSGSRLTLRDAVSVYSRVTGMKVPVVWGGREYRVREVMVPWTRGETAPGWSPKVGIEEGIRLMEGLPARR